MTDLDHQTRSTDLTRSTGLTRTTDPVDISFERIEDDYWLVRDRTSARAEPIGWVRQRLVFEAGRYGHVRADRLCTSLEASRRWFAGLEQRRR